MSDGNAPKRIPRAERTPNRVLRAIREDERHETRAQFAEALTRVALEIGEKSYPDWKYIDRLESGEISWPRAPYRNILTNLCGRTMEELGFTPPARPSNDLNYLGAEVNTALRDAIFESGMEPAQVARKVGVSEKTIQRWVSKEVTPHPGHRWKASRLLGRKESELWPNASSEKEQPPIKQDVAIADDGSSELLADTRPSATFNESGSLRSGRQTGISNPVITSGKPVDAAASRGFDFSDPRRAPSSSGMMDDMKRRSFLMGVATAAGFSAVGGITARETIRHEVANSLTTPYSRTDVEEWQEIVAEYGETYPTTEPAELLKSLMVDLYGLQGAIEVNTGELEHRGLRSVGAMLAAFTAQTVANLGNLRESRRWWRTARQAADESRDPYTMLWIRGREIVRAGYEQRPLSTIVRLINEAEFGIADKSPVTAMPEYLSGKAQTLALMGQSSGNETENTLNQLREAFGALPMSTRSSNDSIFSWGEERMRFTESLTYTYLGNYRKADNAQQAALTLYPKDDLRSPAQIELQRAICLIGSGDVITGVRHAQNIITELPVMHRIRPVADLGHKALRAIPAQSKDHPSVQEYDACLNTAFNAVPELTA